MNGWFFLILEPNMKNDTNRYWKFILAFYLTLDFIILEKYSDGGLFYVVISYFHIFICIWYFMHKLHEAFFVSIHSIQFKFDKLFAYLFQELYAQI